MFDGGATIVQYNVTRKEVEHFRLDRMKEMLTSFSEIGAPARGSLLFCFSGYDDDKKSLSEIPEVTTFIKQVIKDFPCLWYFLRADGTNNHVFLAICPCTIVRSPLLGRIADIPQGERQLVQLDLDAAGRLITDMTGALLSYGVSVGDLPGAREVLREWRETLNL